VAACPGEPGRPIEDAVVALAQSTSGQVRAANELRKVGRDLAGGRALCVRAHDLETTKQRLKALEAKVTQEGRDLDRAAGGGVREGEGGSYPAAIW